MSQNEATAEKREFISVHAKDCLGCGHLISHAKKFYENCHHSRGNDNCPAKTIKLGVGVNYELASDKIAEAIIEGDVQALLRRVTTLAKKDEEVGTRTLELVRQKVFSLMAEQGWTASTEDDEDEESDDEDGEEKETDTGNDALSADVSVALRNLPTELDDSDAEGDAAEPLDTTADDGGAASETEATTPVDEDDEWTDA